MFMATTRNDKLMYVVLVAATVVRVATTLLGASGGEEQNSSRSPPPGRDPMSAVQKSSLGALARELLRPPAHRPAVAPRAPCTAVTSTYSSRS